MSKQGFKLDPNPQPMQKSDLVAPECFTSVDQTELIHSYYSSDDDSVSIGVWECAPSREEFEAYPVNELMTLISGSLTLTHADGAVEMLETGDTFFIAKGTKLIWENSETLRKYYMIAA